MSSEYPLKHIRLQQLYEAGFNVADFACWAQASSTPKNYGHF